MDTKKPWQSKTILLNGVIGLCAFAAMFLPQVGLVPSWIQANGALVASIWAGLNVVLRFISKDKIQLGE